MESAQDDDVTPEISKALQEAEERKKASVVEPSVVEKEASIKPDQVEKSAIEATSKESAAS